MIYKRLRLKLATICTLCTTVILISLTFSFLHLSEKRMLEKEYGVFHGTVNSYHARLYNETVFTNDFYQQLCQDGTYIISLEDNGIPSAFSELAISSSDLKLIHIARQIGSDKYNFDLQDPDALSERFCDFKFSSGREYYAALCYVPRDNGYVAMTCLYSLDSYHQAVSLQRIAYASITAFAIILLAAFSYIFCGYALAPLKKNQEQQVQFIASASHELRSPLNLIGLTLSSLRKSSGARADRFEEIIRSELSRMKRLIDDMLSLSETDSSSWALDFNLVEMNHFLASLCERFQPLTAEKNLSLSCYRASAEPIYCRCDIQRIEQVMTILLSNAVSYTPVSGQIEIKLKKKRRRCQISVIDNGTGISDADKDKIFNRFYRCDSSHKSKEHFGLGLSIAAELVRLHKGSLSVQDTEGGGSTFILTLPC